MRVRCRLAVGVGRGSSPRKRISPAHTMPAGWGVVARQGWCTSVRCDGPACGLPISSGHGSFCAGEINGYDASCAGIFRVRAVGRSAMRACLLEYLRSEFPHRPDSAAVFAAGLVDRLGAVFPGYGYPKATGGRYHSIGKFDDHVDDAR